MAIDFFEATKETLRELNHNEKKLYDFVVKNMNEVKEMSIQKFAADQFVSTTTIFRFTQKLGFSGYTDFINSLLVTSHFQEPTDFHNLNEKTDYRKEYLNNAVESIRVISKERSKEVVRVLNEKPRIYILTDDFTHTIGQYCERLFIGLGFHAYFPETAYQRQNLVNRIRDKDMMIALSYSGKDENLMDFIKRVYLSQHPYLLSITRAESNPLEGLSDNNFYVFADEINTERINLTSSVAMLMIIEMLVYEYMGSI